MNPDLFIRVVLFVILCELCDHVLFRERKVIKYTKIHGGHNDCYKPTVNKITLSEYTFSASAPQSQYP
jgi:hypothetical protein